MRLFTAAFFALLIAAPAAQAQSTIDATDPDGILDIARGYGEATLSKDEVGDPAISGRIDGYTYDVFFYGCEEGLNCTTLMFTATWEIENLTHENMAAWNREKRFGKAFLDDEGYPTVEMNVNLFGGVTHKNFDDTVDWWKVVMNEFSDYFDK